MEASKLKYRHIYIIGPASTGKTTLVTALEEALATSTTITATEPSSQIAIKKPAIIREVARTVLNTHSFTRSDITDSKDSALRLQKLILEAQFKEEELIMNQDRSSSWFISDRSGLDPIVYAKLYAGDEAAEQMILSSEWVALQHRMKSSLVILCEAGCRWLVDDGTRLMPQDYDDWLRMSSTFDLMLTDLGIPYTVMSRSTVELRQRVQLVIDAFSCGSMAFKSNAM